MRLKINKITVEETVRSETLTKKILSNFKGLPVSYVEKAQDRKKGSRGDELLIAKQKSRFIKKCPGTPGYACCDYYVLNVGIGCSVSCTYCYLHHYMNAPFTVYANTGGLVREVEDFCERNENRIIRLGSGEFVDSLEFDELTGLNELLVPAFGNIPNLIFEIKTKRCDIEHLLPLKHNGKTVVSWSVNPQKIADKEEAGAASLEDRLKAAKRCQAAGYKIGFHFDPIIYYAGWFGDYSEVAKRIFDHIDAENIAWISLGALRFNPSIKPIIKENFPQSDIVYGELVPGLDGKLRYFMGIRKKIFSKMVSLIRSHSKNVPVYLCMESKSLAEQTGATPCFSLNPHKLGL